MTAVFLLLEKVSGAGDDENVVSQISSQDGKDDSPILVRCCALGIALIMTHGDPMPCTPPCSVFLVLCYLVIVGSTLGSAVISQKGERERERRRTQLAIPPCCASGFPFGAQEVGRWAERLSHVNTHTHTRRVRNSDVPLPLSSRCC